MNILIHLRIAGALMLSLALSHFYIPRKVGWVQDMQKVSLFTRQVFYVHCFFICLVLVMMGLLSLVFTDALLEHGLLARLVLGGLGTFWTARLFIQLFVYDSKLWRGNRFNTIVHVVFTFAWAYLAIVYWLAMSQ